MSIFRQLYIQVLLGILLAVVLGLTAPAVALAMKPLGDAFIALLRMMLAPIIFCAVVLGTLIAFLFVQRPASRLAIIWVTAGWDRLIAWAARVTLWLFATAKNARNCRSGGM